MANLDIIRKVYYPVQGEDATHIKVSVYYDIGGENVFTGETIRRGYYISVTPVKKENGMESFMAWTGARFLLKSVQRKSQKAEGEVINIAANRVEKLLAYICEENGLVLLDS